MIKEKVTSTDIKKALDQYHYKDLFVTECKNGSTYFPPAQGLLKFDGLAITKSYTKPCITGYEIKVSRSDFLQDNKWHLYLQYCNEFYFVVPNGMVDKSELPDNVGLIYYYPDSTALKKKKKALYRDIEEPIGVYKYILYSRYEPDRIPFYESRAEFAKDYMKDKKDKKVLGEIFGTYLAKELQEAHKRLEILKDADHDIQLLRKIEKILKKYDICGWHWKEEDILQDIEKALTSSYPSDLEYVKRDITDALDRITRIEEEHIGKADEANEKM